ncbi:MAG: ADP-ribosylglycohydrolase family protein [Xanthomonadales bacterium]|nr:ADP-ribosylglycohydrolase family protein [Xanthomonadales bacterium]
MTTTRPQPVPPTRRQRFRGCLLAGAIGDALGAPVEFFSLDQIHAHFGPDGITGLVPAYGRVGAITDDTQMTLFTAEGLLRAFVRHANRGIASYPDVVAGAYLRWLRSQDENPDAIEEADGWLIGHRPLHQCRAPGNTCLSALQEMQAARCGGRSANNNSKGCGGVMRVAPVGLFASHWHDHAKAFDLACELAALTHGHPTGQLPAGVLASLVHDLSLGHGLGTALDRAMAVLAKRDDADATITALGNARSLAAETIRGNCARRQALSRLGEGWIAEEALAMSVYCALVANDLRDGLILAVNHDGDSDSTGAITGNLLGALWGEAAIPAHWREQVELAEVIAEIADDLHDCRDWKIGDSAEDPDFDRPIWNKYPGC